MIEWTEIVVNGVSLSVIVVGLVNALKQFGMDDKYAPFANGILATIGFLLVTWAIPNFPQIEPVLKIVAGGVITFLAASGIHQLGKTS